jgi:hypothetical protein
VSTNSSHLVTRLDALPRRRGVVGFPSSVAKRYAEAHGGWLGSITA